MTRKFLLLMLAVCSSALEQTKDVANGWLSDLAWPHDYVLKRASSFDRSGGNRVRGGDGEVSSEVAGAPDVLERRGYAERGPSPGRFLSRKTHPLARERTADLSTPLRFGRDDKGEIRGGGWTVRPGFFMALGGPAGS